MKCRDLPFPSCLLRRAGHFRTKKHPNRFRSGNLVRMLHMAPQVGLEPTTTRLTAGCSAIELLRNMGSGNDLSSRTVSSQLLSALKGLTSVFGMGTGGTPSSLSPEFVSEFVSFPSRKDASCLPEPGTLSEPLTGCCRCPPGIPLLLCTCRFTVRASLACASAEQLLCNGDCNTIFRFCQRRISPPGELATTAFRTLTTAQEKEI